MKKPELIWQYKSVLSSGNSHEIHQWYADYWLAFETRYQRQLNSLPATDAASKSNQYRRIRGERSSRNFVDKVGTEGLSVSTRKKHPTRYLSNFSYTHVIANNSFSISTGNKVHEPCRKLDEEVLFWLTTIAQFKDHKTINYTRQPRVSWWHRRRELVPRLTFSWGIKRLRIELDIIKTNLME